MNRNCLLLFSALFAFSGDVAITFAVSGNIRNAFRTAVAVNGAIFGATVCAVIVIILVNHKKAERYMTERTSILF